MKFKMNGDMTAIEVEENKWELGRSAALTVGTGPEYIIVSVAKRILRRRLGIVHKSRDQEPCIDLIKPSRAAH